MKIFRKRILPKIWLSAIAVGVLFLGFAGATVKAANSETGSYFDLTAVSNYLFGSAAMVDTVQLSSATYSVAESNNGFAAITVTRFDGGAATATVDYATNNGSAVGGTTCAANIDYITTSGTLTFNAGVTSQTFIVAICNDNVFENSEIFNVDLTNPIGTILGQPSSAQVTITDTDPSQPGVLQFSSTTFSGTENGAANTTGGTATITVNRIGGSNGAVSANFTLTNGTAFGGADCNTAGVDFVNPGVGTVNFANNATTATITVQLCNDLIAEGGNETFTITLSNAGGGATIGSPSTATVTIIDADPNTPGMVQFNPTTYTVRESAGTVTLTVTRTGGTSGAVSVGFFLLNNQAAGGSSCGIAGIDYVNQSGTLTFASGQTSQTITVTICSDTIDEFPDGESFTAVLVNPTGGLALGANSSAVVTILDDENGVFQFNPVAIPVTETQGTQNVSVTVTRTDIANTGSAGTATVSFTLANGTATGGTTCAAGVDFINPAGTVDGILTFESGITSQTFTLQVCGDSAFEVTTNETFTITLNNPTGGALIGPNNVATVTITDNDTAQPGVFNIGAAPASTPPGTPAPTATVTEGTNVTITITRTGGTDTAVTVQDVTVNETAIGGLSCPTAAANGGTVDYVTEQFPTNTFPNSPNGSQTTSFDIVICNDTFFEPTETFRVELQSPTGGATLGSNSFVRITILDNDAQTGTLNFNPTTVQVNEAAGTVPVTVVRTIGTDTAVAATVSFADGTATGGASCTAGIDYINTNQSVNFATGNGQASQTQTVNVTICNDTLNEDAETFTAVLSNPAGGVTLGANTTSTVTILDDEEGTIQFSTATFGVAPAVIVNEGDGTATVTVTRVSNGGNVGQVTVDFTLNNGVAAGGSGSATGGTACTAGVDFVNPAGTTDGTITFAPGVTQATFAIQICQDTLDEPNELISITLNNAQNGALIGTINTATLLITDDDATPTLSITNVTQAEGNVVGASTNFVFTVNTSAASGQAVTANFAVTSGTATGGAACTAGVDFITPANGTVTFAAGLATAQTITVAVCGDLDVEANETFTVTLSNPSNATVPTATATGTITNDDGVNGTITVGDIRILEGNSGQSTAQVTFNLTGNPNGQNVTTTFTTSGGTATGGAACTVGVDYITPTAAQSTVTFTGAGNSQQTVNITICGDINENETTEFFFVNLSGQTGNGTITDNQGVVTIIDDDRAAVADFDRDRRTDIAVFRPSNNFFYFIQSFNGIFRAEQLGAAGDIPVPGDYDSDSVTDLAVYRPSTGAFIIQLSTNQTISTIAIGAPGDIPVPADYDGDGDTDVAVFRPSNGTFYRSNNPATNFDAIQFGQSGDVPVVGDYDGDGRADVAVFRNGLFFVQRTTGGFFGIQFGQAGDRPLVGDYDGDGRTDFTVYRPSGNAGQTGGVFFTFRSLTQTSLATPFGATEDIPTAGDYDGDGITDISVFRPSTGQFFIIGSSNNGFSAFQFGQSGDIPVASRYQPNGATPAQ